MNKDYLLAVAFAILALITVGFSIFGFLSTLVFIILAIGAIAVLYLIYKIIQIFLSFVLIEKTEECFD